MSYGPVLTTYPIAIVEDRYHGTYSGGEWLAIAMADAVDNGAYRIIRCLDGGPHGDDTDAMFFWQSPPGWIAAGHTPQSALDELMKKMRPTKP